LREIGRIAKMMFLLDYFTQRELWHRIQAGLNRVESYHALVRALCVGQFGEIGLCDLEAQLNRASCLQLVAAMVISWNAACLFAAIDKLWAEGMTITPDQLAHILPTMSEHITRLERYDFDPAAASVQTNVSVLLLRSCMVQIFHPFVPYRRSLQK